MRLGAVCEPAERRKDDGAARLAVLRAGRAQNEACILAAKAEGIGQHALNIGFPGRVGHHI